MRPLVYMSTLAVALSFATASPAVEISTERGLKVSIVSGCHDCHTEGYRGKIDPEKALRGNRLGFRGPWGTTYARNLRISAQSLSEDGFVLFLSNLETSPPMPWYNVRAMEEADMRSLYRYIKSLGDPGRQAPTAVGPDMEPTTPYIVLAPPQQPKGCERDLDCGIGQVCGGASKCLPR